MLFPGYGRIPWLDILDSVKYNFIWICKYAIGMRKHERPFVYRINALYIQCRITFCKSQLLSQKECLFEVKFFLEHFGENKICRSVYNCTHRMQKVVIIIFFQVTDHGYGSACGSFIQNRMTCFFLKFK